MELCLGTVQFGMNYGINNADGRPSVDSSVEMMNYATTHGITTLDTATAYNEAEMVVGKFLGQTTRPINVVSKLRPNCIDVDTVDVEKVVRQEIEGTLERLGVESLYGYLLHNADYLYNSKVLSTLRKLKDEHIISNYGVSIYMIEDGYVGIDEGCTIMQMPYNVFDQRARRGGLLSKAIDSGVEIHTRSAFLQGLLMMSEDKIPAKLSQLVPHVRKLNEICTNYSIDKKSLLIGLVKQTVGIDKLVFGVDNMSQLVEFIQVFDNVNLPKKLALELETSFEGIDDNLILPNKWGI